MAYYYDLYYNCAIFICSINYRVYLGANYFGYCADITVSFPVNGKFTDDQKLIYNAVLAATLVVHEKARPGVNWVDMHRLSNRVLLTKLKEGGLLRGEVDDMMKDGINGVFQPHGLGHLIGLLQTTAVNYITVNWYRELIDISIDYRA